MNNIDRELEKYIDSKCSSNELSEHQAVDLIARSVRARLKSSRIGPREGGLYKLRTNCVGAYLKLVDQLRSLDSSLEIKPVLIKRLPWQHNDASFSIHIAGLFETTGLKRYLVDSTPSPGYLYGSSPVVDDNSIYDPFLDLRSNIVLINSSEFRAILDIYNFEAGESNVETAHLAMNKLKNIPAYMSRAAFKLLQATGSKEYSTVLRSLPVGSLRRSYADFLGGGYQSDLQDFYSEDDSIRSDTINKISALIKTSTNLLENAHWRASLREANGAIKPLSLLHPLDFLSEKNPILTYERIQINQDPSVMTSNLYYHNSDCEE